MSQPSAMDSLDATPSAEYASLVTLTILKESSQQVQQNGQFDTYDRNQNLHKTNQEHIYAQVTPNGHCQPIPSSIEESKTEVTDENQTNETPNKALMNNTILIRNPTIAFNNSKSVPDIRKTYPNLFNLCQNNYGSLNVTKEKERAVVQKTESSTISSVFSISGRRVVVSTGFNNNGTHKQQGNDIKEPIVQSNLQNVWSSRSTLNSDESDTKLQVCTDCISLCLFVPGTVLCILSPWLLVPIYIIPSFSGSHFQTLIWISCIGSAILVFMGCMVGNMMWYRKGNGWKCRLHCGKGPKNYYWGDSLTSKRNIHNV